MNNTVDLPWFVSRYHISTLARLEALAATPTKRRKLHWYRWRMNND